MSTRAVVTGIGITAPNGLGTEQYWERTCAGSSGIRPVARFDASGYTGRLAGEVLDFDAAEHLPSRLLPQTDHMTRLALTAADQALADAGIDSGEQGEAAFARGVVTASSAGGFEFGQRELQRFFSQGPEYMGAYMSFAWFYAVNSGQISIRHGLKGPGGVVVSDQAGGLDALAQARRQLRKGSSLIVSGGVDGSICSWGWVAQQASGRISAGDDPSTAYLPFDARAAGHVPAEGGAILILEDAEAATQRGVSVYGEIAGYASTFDPDPRTGREPALRRSVTGALDDAGVTLDEIDVVLADGAAIPDLDQVEADALVAVFGAHGVPVTVPKTMVGRMYAGAGALDVATALLMIRDQVIPPTVNVSRDARYPIDLVIGAARPAPLCTVLVIARGHGGFNSAMVVRAVDNSFDHSAREKRDRHA